MSGQVVHMVERKLFTELGSENLRCKTHLADPDALGR